MTKIIRIAAVVGFAALSAVAGLSMAKSANDGGATHWFAASGARN